MLVEADQVQQQLGAISEPTRFRIVELLRTGPRSVGSITDALSLGQPQVSRHLHILADAGVVEAAKRAQQRIYQLRPEPMYGIEEWIQGYAAIWTQRMDRLDHLLVEMDRTERDER